MTSKRILTLLALTIATVLGVVGPEMATPLSADQRNFWFLNNTGQQIDRAYVSPHESGSWGGDVLGDASLPDGTGTAIVFPSSLQTSCVFDFRLMMHDGSVQTYTEGRDVCRVHAVQFDQDSSQGF